VAALTASGVAPSTAIEYLRSALTNIIKPSKDAAGLAEELGILQSNEKIAYRVTYIVDPEGIIRWVSVYDLSVGRNVKEVIRVLDALQTDELCPCNWQKGENTL
jgi:alkyl hydroperoxide reductase subunit AhpC